MATTPTRRRRFSAFQLGRMCSEGRKALKGRVISEAWSTCEHGTWMAFWLFNEHLSGACIPGHELRPLCTRAGSPVLFMTGSVSDEADRRYADLLRAHYTSTGRRRKVR